MCIKVKPRLFLDYIQSALKLEMVFEQLLCRNTLSEVAASYLGVLSGLAEVKIHRKKLRK